MLKRERDYKDYYPIFCQKHLIRALKRKGCQVTVSNKMIMKNIIKKHKIPETQLALPKENKQKKLNESILSNRENLRTIAIKIGSNNPIAYQKMISFLKEYEKFPTRKNSSILIQFN